MNKCEKCGWPLYNGGGGICSACRQGVTRTDWRDELAQVERALDEELGKGPHGSEAYIRACRARIRGIRQAHEEDMKLKNEDVFGKAIDKIRDEMAASKSRYVQVVGSMLTEFVQKHPDCAEKILAQGKTVAGSLDAMRSEAKKQAQGGVGVIDDQQGMEIVLGYFGIKAEADGAEKTAEAERVPERAAEQADELSLDALLGGL